jgi:hypothetical protein
MTIFSNNTISGYGANIRVRNLLAARVRPKQWSRSTNDHANRPRESLAGFSHAKKNWMLDVGRWILRSTSANRSAPFIIAAHYPASYTPQLYA